MENFFEKNEDMPVGLKMALTQNLDALNRFTALPREHQRSFIDRARSIESKQEMQYHVDTLMRG